jgi:hypothetical protein
MSDTKQNLAPETKTRHTAPELLAVIGRASLPSDLRGLPREIALSRLSVSEIDELDKALRDRRRDLHVSTGQEPEDDIPETLPDSLAPGTEIPSEAGKPWSPTHMIPEDYVPRERDFRERAYKD